MLFRAGVLLTLGGSGRVGCAVWALQAQAHTDRARHTVLGTNRGQRAQFPWRCLGNG